MVKRSPYVLCRKDWLRQLTYRCRRHRGREMISHCHYSLIQPPILPIGPLAFIISQPNQPDQTTNELALALAPQIDTGQPISTTRDANNNVTITLNCIPDVRPNQRVALLLGDSEVVAQPFSTQTNALTFLA